MALTGEAPHQVVSGWRNSSEEALKLYLKRKDELSTVDECLQWGSQVVIPPASRSPQTSRSHSISSMEFPKLQCVNSCLRIATYWGMVSVSICNLEWK